MTMNDIKNIVNRFNEIKCLSSLLKLFVPVKNIKTIAGIINMFVGRIKITKEVNKDISIKILSFERVSPCFFVKYSSKVTMHAE